MQTSLCRFYVTVLLLTSTMCFHHDDTDKQSVNDVSFSCWKKRPPKIRQERTTHVKAILANPKLSSSQILAEKFAKETLKSPKTLETFKKLTEGESSDNLINNKNHVRRKVKNVHSFRKKLNNGSTKLRKNSRKHHSHHRRKPKKKNHKKKHHHLHRRNPDFRASQNSMMIPSKVRQTREILKNSSNNYSKKRRGFYKNPYKSSQGGKNYDEYGFYEPNLSVPAENLMLPNDYKMAEMPEQPVGAYSFNRKSDNYNLYNSDFSQELNDQFPVDENTGLVNTRSLHLSENEITTEENFVSNCTTLKPDHHRTTVSLKNESTNEQHNYKHSSGSETKQVANEILNDIIEELEELKVGRNQDNPGEGLPCKISGTWMTTEAGIELKMKVSNHTMIVSIEKTKQLGNSIQSQILNTTWNITGHVPFQRGAPFSLIASNNHAKSLAVFVGACKVCQGVDTIEGAWTVFHEPKTCRDFQVSTNVHNDIFRRSNVHDDQVKHKELSKLGKNNGTITSHPAD